VSTRRRFRLARREAAAALLSYLDDRTPTSERALLNAAHELEAISVRRKLERISQRGRATMLRRVAASR